jgi:Uncharacterized protein conserved in bacteria
MSGQRSIVIVGGGASGIILALHLLQSPSQDLRVTIVEKRPSFGRGLAYSTTLDDHLLNVSAEGMSAYADDPEHFRRWLARKGLGQPADTPYYAPRGIYGDYLEELITTLAKEEPERLRLVQGEVVSITPTASGVEVLLANGASLVARTAVLAVGHDEQPAPPARFAVRMGSAEDTPLDPSAPVLILGTGLSMIDAWLSLQAGGHQGGIIAVSRRGLLPWPHRPGRPMRLDSADIPLGTELSYFVDWFRDLVRETKQSGGDWRDVVDGLRPFNQRIWQSWPASAKRRFLNHTKAWWDIHRHRMAPEIHTRMKDALRTGRLKVLAARVLAVRQEEGSLATDIQHRQTREIETLHIARIYDCTGIARNLEDGSHTIIRSLIERGLARSDPFKLGLDVTRECAVIDADGSASGKLFAVGPLTRGTFFEIDAVPDIRLQCKALAEAFTAP